MASFDEFKSQIRTKGLVRNNRFSVDFTIPSGLNTSGNSNYALGAKKALLFCNRASIPGMEFSTKAIRTTGETRAIPFDRNFDDVTLTFILDNTGLVKWYFDSWMGIVQDRETRLWKYLDEYITPSMFIHSYDLKENLVYSIELIDAWPKAISSINLDFNDPTVSTISVKFTYRYWRPVPSTKLPATGAGAGRGFVIPTDPFITLQDTLSNGESFLNPNQASMPLLGSVSALASSSATIAGTISNLSNRVSGLEIIDSGNTSAENAKAGALSAFDTIKGVMSGNTSLLNTVSALNMSNEASTAIQSGLGVVRDLSANFGTIASTIALFDKSGGASNVARQLGNIQRQTESLRTNVFSLNSKINTTITSTTNAISQIGKIVAPNTPKVIR